MNEKYLIINAGSSSLKFSLYEANGNLLVNGLVEKIGEEYSSYKLKFDGKTVSDKCVAKDHSDAVKIMLTNLIENDLIVDLNEIKGIGHRVLHGGEKYSDSVLIDDDVVQDIKDLTKLGPLHHPGEIAGILSMRKILPNVPQVAVFDTAFHQTMPKENYLYAVPYEWYSENGVRKYGFHGSSHKYITEYLKDYYGRDDINAIICHIGSGASLSCIKDGKCFDTSMGLTPLDGLIMGTRSGSIDPSIIEYISNERNMSVSEINHELNKNSGLLGLSGKNDFRDVMEMANNGDEKAITALKMMKNSIIKLIGQYYFELEGDVDSIVFTAGVGENSAELREDIVNSISPITHTTLNGLANNNSHFKINSDDNLDILVIPTDEEHMILVDTYRLCNSRKQINTNKGKIKTLSNIA